MFSPCGLETTLCIGLSSQKVAHYSDRLLGMHQRRLRVAIRAYGHEV
jgi:hypothetical protein